MVRSDKRSLRAMWIGITVRIVILALLFVVKMDGVPQCFANDRSDRIQNHSSDKRREIAFIDKRVDDLEFFSNELGPQVPVYILVQAEDGLAQMIRILREYEPFDTIHIFSHGSPGRIWLGATALDQDKLQRHAQVLASIGDHLKDNGDILLYGCQMGSGRAGRQFINALGKYTAANIAASDNFTGAAHLSGDWVLEKIVGRPAPESYRHNEILKKNPSVLAFPNTISWPSDPFGGGTQTSTYTFSTADLGNIDFKATDDELSTAFSSLTWMSGGGLAHASLWNGSYVGILTYESIANYTSGIWFAFATQNGDEFDFTSFYL